MNTRQFFLNQLQTLRRNTGLLQFEHLRQEEQPEKAIEDLINRLEWARNQFKYIPEELAQKIITENIMKEPDLRGIYPNKVYQWLQSYWSQLDPGVHQKLMGTPDMEDEPEPLTGKDALKWIKKFKDEVRKMKGAVTYEGSIKGKFKDLMNMPKGNVKFRIVDCHYCNNENPEHNKYEREECPYCGGEGKVKKTK
jgi:hypothetical protein